MALQESAVLSINYFPHYLHYMIRKLIPFFLFISILVTACSHSPDPKEVTDSFFRKMKGRDFDGAFKLTTDSSHSVLQNIIDAFFHWEKTYGKRDQPALDSRAPLRIDIDSSIITGNQATVFVIYKRGDTLVSDLVLPLVKEGRKWKIDFASPRIKMTYQPSNWVEKPGFALGL
jgi:hypothetical protein